MARRRRPAWEPVPPGEIQDLARRLRGRRQRRLFLRAGAALLGSLTAGGLLAWWLGGKSATPPARPGVPGDFYYGGIACSEVKAWADAYGQGALDAGTRGKIADHLRQCASCATFYKAKGHAARTPRPGEPDVRHL